MINGGYAETRQRAKLKELDKEMGLTREEDLDWLDDYYEQVKEEKENRDDAER